MECLLGYYPYIIYNNNNLPNSYWIVHELIENNPITINNKRNNLFFILPPTINYTFSYKKNQSIKI